MATDFKKPRGNGYRGEPSPSLRRFTPLLPNQRLCLRLIEPGKRCVEPRRHKGECKA